MDPISCVRLTVNDLVIVRSLNCSPRVYSQTQYNNRYPPSTGVHITRLSSRSLPRPAHRRRPRMPKKRRSLQSIFSPSFLHVPHSPTHVQFPSTSTRSRSNSTASTSELYYYDGPSPSPTVRSRAMSTMSRIASPPPDFLLDDDPFANLSEAPSASALRSHPHPLSITPTTTPKLSESTNSPRSPLSSPSPSSVSIPPISMPDSGISRALSTRPAHHRPAFAPRPSLPSLHILAQMNVVLPKKVLLQLYLISD